MRERGVMELRGRKVGVMGLGLSGAAAAQFLLARGAKVVVSEVRAESDLGALPGELRAAGAIVECGGHPRDVFAGCSLVIASPGVPPGVAALRAALDHGAEIVGEVELASRHLQGTLAAVTGSNGKSTVTALAAAMLDEAGRRARPCGNIGLPLISLVGPP
ncbi:MAG TPA: UDP-N-acetylmuramoyl-L-alanine--D-glutamate ligase, partial [Verrucomicrobiae bacterium]|nr:UDP-N-acetylmuramoyl-L-alanine--D-glutamate ligase [Verrucomicrobiae bacterium]